MGDWVGMFLLAGGVGFSIIGSIGILRMPDFYTRAHGAGKLDTLALILSMFGLAVLQGVGLSGVKLVLIAVFVAVANPAATHALGRSAMRAGLEPWTRDPRRSP